MAKEELMDWLPAGCEKVEPSGPFFIRNNGGSYTIVAYTAYLVTCGGPDGREDAIDLAVSLNKIWDQKLAEHQQRMLEKIAHEAEKN